jgi:hypothetical protein
MPFYQFAVIKLSSILLTVELETPNFFDIPVVLMPGLLSM